MGNVVYNKETKDIQVREVRVSSVSYKKSIFQFLRAAWPTRWPVDEQEPREYPWVELYTDIFNPDKPRYIQDKLRGLFLPTGDNSKRRFQTPIFLGVGLRSLFWVRVLHDRLDHGLSMLGGNQQPGGDAQEYSEGEEAIKDVVRDIAVALTGYTIEFKDKVEHGSGSLPVPPRSPRPRTCPGSKQTDILERQFWEEVDEELHK